MPVSSAAACSGQGSGEGGDPARIPVQRRTRHTASAARSRATSPVPCKGKAGHHAWGGPGQVPEQSLHIVRMYRMPLRVALPLQRVGPRPLQLSTNRGTTAHGALRGRLIQQGISIETVARTAVDDVAQRRRLQFSGVATDPD